MDYDLSPVYFTPVKRLDPHSIAIGWGCSNREAENISNDYDIKILNSLIETVIYSADGYTEAMKAAHGSRFEGINQRRGAERRKLTTELQGKVRALGGEPEDEGTLLAGTHRMFLYLRNSMSSDDKAIVDQVEAGEEHIKHKFEDAQRDRDLSAATRADIDEAYVVVKAGHDEIRDLKHSLHAGA